MSDATDATALRFDVVAEELQLALEHCRVAAQHYRDEVIPRGAAHAWAARGHLLNAEALLNEQAREHASKAVPHGD